MAVAEPRASLRQVRARYGRPREDLGRERHFQCPWPVAQASAPAGRVWSEPEEVAGDELRAGRRCPYDYPQLADRADLRQPGAAESASALRWDRPRAEPAQSAVAASEEWSACVHLPSRTAAGCGPAH